MPLLVITFGTKARAKPFQAGSPANQQRGGVAPAHQQRGVVDTPQIVRINLGWEEATPRTERNRGELVTWGPTSMMWEKQRAF